MLLANWGGPPLAGVIVNPSLYSPASRRTSRLQSVIAAARASGLRDVPDATPAPAFRWSGPPTAKSNNDAEHVERREAIPRFPRA